MKSKTLAFLVLSCLSICGAAVAEESDPAPSDVNPVVATVNGDAVYAAQISLVMRSVAEDFKQQGQEVPPTEQIMQIATSQAIEQKLLAQEARRFGMRADESRVTQRMEAAAQQAGGRAALQAGLNQGGSNLDQLENMYRELELGRLYIMSRIQPTIQVTDDEITEFFTANPQFFSIDEQVHARHILIRVEPDATDDQLRQSFERAQRARARAITGEDFATLARELSDGPGAPDGGDLGFFTKSRMIEPIADAAFALQPGEISPVVQTQFGYHVIKVEERRPPGELPLDQARDQARSMIVNQKTMEKVGELLKNLSESADIEFRDPPIPDAAP
jgi:peptidyl-prolyl cis-trans isomerase C